METVVVLQVSELDSMRRALRAVMLVKHCIVPWK